MKVDEKRVENLMAKLDISREDALQVLKDDDAIDHGEKLFELSKEQKQVEKKARSTGTKAVYNFTKRERKPNEIKGLIVAKLAENLAEWDIFDEDFAQTIEITNKERQISFKIGENEYELTLIQKRKSKK